MPKEATPYPQVTEDQIELWLTMPVTKAYLQCLEFKRGDIAEQAGTGRLVDSSNADLTHALLHRALGQQDGYAEAGFPRMILDFYEMIFRPPPEDEAKDASQ